MQVGDPKLRFPISENACPFSFFSLVHRTTSHGGDGVSVSLESSTSWLTKDALRLWPERKAGEAGFGERLLGVEMREEKRRSKGRKEGVGLPRRGREASDGRMLLLGEDMIEPWRRQLMFSRGKEVFFRACEHT